MLACKGVYGDRTDVFWIFQKKIPLGPLGNISANFSKVNHEIFKVLHVKVSQKNVSGKKFLECYKDQNEWKHLRATTNISRC